MRQFHQLFAGRDDVHGTYTISNASKSTKKGQKRLGKARTVSKPGTKVTKALFQKHLDGKQGLGIVPIRKDGTVSWFAIDVDDYSTDGKLHVDLAKKIVRLNLPLVIFSTKSGGAHLFCFLTEPASASDVREHAEKYLKVLGLPSDTEIFPKQEAIQGSDMGSWINIPYMGGTRPCLGADGKSEMTLEEFYEYAAEMEVHPSDLGFRARELEQPVTSNEADEDWEGAPPCVVTMLRDGIEEGGRNNALTHIAVYLRRAFPDDWALKLLDINDDSVHPKLHDSDVRLIAKSIDRRDFHYMCKQSPMVGICDKPKCLDCKFGIGDGEGDYANFIVEKLRKVGTEDPYYIITVDGSDLKLPTAELLSFPKFETAVFERLDKVITPMKPGKWKQLIASLMDDMEKEEAPNELSTSGAITGLFMNWTSQRLNGRAGNLDRIVDGQPFYDKKANLILFRGLDFLNYVHREGNKIYDARVVWLTLSDMGGDQVERKIKSKKLKVWSFPVGEPWFNINDSEEGAF